MSINVDSGVTRDRQIVRSTRIPAILALVVIAAAWLFAEYQNRKVFEQSLRTEVLGNVSLIRARLEGHVNSNIQLVRGLIATEVAEPGMDQRRFQALSTTLLQKRSHIRNIAGAPGFVVSLMYPMQGNERAIGLNYMTNPVQRESVLRARDTGELVLAGPLPLVQGGTGLIGRFPVFIPGERDEPEFWGIISAVVDVDQLYEDSGLLVENLPIDIAIAGADGLGAAGNIFFGSPDVYANDPVLVDVILPTGSWQLAAVPKGGWTLTPPNVWTLRLLMLVAGAVILVPIILSGRLIEERQRNISALKMRESELERVSRRLGLALDTSKVAVWEINIGEEGEYWDSRMKEINGYPADDTPRSSQDWERRVHPDDRERASRDLVEVLLSRGSYASQYRIVLDDGEIRHIRALGTVYENPGALPKLVSVNWDVTADVGLHEELKRANALTEARNTELESTKARIEHNALHDSLTGLPNRRYLDETLAEHALQFQSNGEKAALLQIDLDRFKQINDTLGHTAGDAMLVHAAHVLKSTVEPSDFVARVGGDEFVIVRRWAGTASGISVDALSDLADRIIERMQQPFTYQGHECRVGVSIGIATDTDFLADPLRLLVNADIALYRAKDLGRNRHQFFNDALQAEIVATKRVADDILTGLDESQFVAFYQPQFDAETLEVIGVEALARWKHPVDGLLAPQAFMRIAEELNVVSAIDRLILEQAIDDLQSWEEMGIAIPKASVNVSARRLRDDQLIQSLKRMNIREGAIAFELVESIFLDDTDELLTWNVDHIKELGIDIEIDDFGTGYASIVSLMKLKPRRLKIDRQLILPIVNSPGQRQLVGSIIDIGHSLGIEVLAEGVETMEHARLLRQLGCDALQGYAFARPMSGPDLISFVQQRQWRKAS